MANPSIAVVILSWNGWHFLRQFLPSVLKTNYSNFQVYVADNASTDETVDGLRTQFPQVNVLPLAENRGFAGGYNEALKQVEADYYVLLNQDVEVEPDWLRPVIVAMEADPSIAVSQPKIKAERQKDFFEYAGAAGGYMDRFAYTFCRGRLFDTVEQDKGQYDTPAEIFWASGAAFFIRSAVYHEQGGLDADFFAHMEEIDLCWRAKNAGHRVVCIPESVVYHVGGGSLPQGSPRKTYLNFRNSLTMAIKNWPTQALWWKLPWRMIMDGVAGIQALARGDWPTFRAILKSHTYLYSHLDKLLTKRKQTQAIIKSHRVGPGNRTGLYGGSIVGAYFIRGKKNFRELSVRKFTRRENR